MTHPERVEDYLGHIAEAIARADGYLQPVSDLAAFRTSPQIQDAVVRNIEVIGEAATHIARVSPDFIQQHPEIPWAQMRRMRNIVAHAYFAVDWEIVWRTVRHDFPGLGEQIDRLLGHPPPGPSLTLFR